MSKPNARWGTYGNIQRSQSTNWQSGSIGPSGAVSWTGGQMKAKSVGITPGAAELRAKLTHDMSPPVRDMDVVRAELKPMCKGLDAWIAGGFAADPAKAGDVDVFIVNGGMSDEIDDLMAAWKLEDATVWPNLHTHYEGQIGNSMRFCGKLPSGMPLDMVFTEKSSIREVLESFDHPLLGTAINVETGDWTNITTVGKHWQLAKKNPLRSLYRRLKVVTRYGLPDKRSEQELSGILVQCIVRWEAMRQEKSDDKQLPADWKLLVAQELDGAFQNLKAKMSL